MDASMENKMGLPPPYEAATAGPQPPPGYFAAGGPPPEAGFVVPPLPNAPPQVPSRTTVVTRGSPAKLGPGPTGLPCPHCHKTVVTHVEYTPNNRTHIVAAILCAIGSCCCLCCVPYCMRSCRTANHYCPSCKAFVGAFTPS